MSSSDHYWKVPLVLGALFQLALGGPGGGVAVARSLQAETSGTQVTVQTGAGQIVRLKQDVSSLFSADPKVAEVRPASPSSFFVFGVGAGNTTIEAASATGEVIGRYVVRVVPSSYRASVLQQGAAMSSPGVRVEPTPDGLSIEGSVSDPQAAQKLVDHARSLAGKEGYIADYMTVPGSLQVNLRVRVVEMERTLVRELGVEWKNVNALGTSAVVGVATQSPLAALSNLQSSVGWLSRFNVGSQRVTLETVVDALAQDGLVHSLAEPNLTTLSGQPASFLVGGEYPIPVSNYGGTTTVQFKQYGISLGFVPTVLAEGRINLHVRPEVSALSSDGAVTLSTSSNSVQIPAIHVRRADTTVELGSGQSFVIAGLLSDTSKLTTTGLPWLGDIPVLGALFKSNSFQKDETELVIIVTPYLVKPVDNIHDLHTPDEDWVPPGDMERIFLMRQSSTDVRKRRAWQKLDAGDAGFMVE